MTKLIIDNINTTISGPLSNNYTINEEYKKGLREALSYESPQAKWSNVYKTNQWDGRISLLKTPRNENMFFPAGLTYRASEYLKTNSDIKYSIVDNRVRPTKNVCLRTAFKENNREIRFYQKRAADLAIEKTRGVICVGTGGGKTMLACELLTQASVVPYVCIVPGIQLLRQTHAEFMKYLRVGDETPHVGFMGAGICDINFEGVNVMTYHTAFAAFNLSYDETTKKLKHDELAGEKVKKSTAQLENEHQIARGKFRNTYNAALKEWGKVPQGKEYRKFISKKMKKLRKELYAAKLALTNRRKSLKNKSNIRLLLEKAKGFLVDEVHIAAEITEELGKKMPNAYYRHAMTATLDRGNANDEIRIEGMCGRVLIEVSASDLISLGYSVPANCFMVPILTDALPGAPKVSYHDKYREFITDCWERNYRIKQAAEAFFELGKNILIFVDKIEHGLILEDMIENSVFVPGSDKGDEDPSQEERDYRKRMLNECENHQNILIATPWVNVGIDIPKVSVLFFGGSVQSYSMTKQMVGRGSRCLGKDYEESVKNGKKELIVVGFLDKEATMHKHSLSLIKTLKSESKWQVRKLRSY